MPLKHVVHQLENARLEGALLGCQVPASLSIADIVTELTLPYATALVTELYWLFPTGFALYETPFSFWSSPTESLTRAYFTSLIKRGNDVSLMTSTFGDSDQRFSLEVSPTRHINELTTWTPIRTFVPRAPQTIAPNRIVYSDVLLPTYSPWEVELRQVDLA